MSLLFMGLAGSALIIVTLLVRFFTVHKLPRWVFLVFWYVALVRLLVPYSLPSSFNAFSLLDTLFSKTQPSSETIGIEKAMTEVTTMISTTVSDVAPIAIKPGSSMVAGGGAQEITYAATSPSAGGADVITPKVVEQTFVTPEVVDVASEGSATALFPDSESVFSSLTNALQATSDIWLPLWIIGSICCAAIFAFAYWKSHRKFRESLPVEDPYVVEWLSRQRIRRHLQVRSSDQITTPVSYGFFKPVILLPKHFDLDDREGLLYVLTHEYLHIRRFDSVTKLLIIAAVCLYWFNPLVWALYVLANRDIEFATDAAVVRTCGTTTRSQYALTLISMAEAKSSLAPLCNHFSRNVIEERITAIMTMKKTPWVSVALSAVLLTGTTTAFATTPQAQLTSDDTSESAAVSEAMLASDSDAVAYQVTEDENGKVVVTLNEEKVAEVTEGGVFSMNASVDASALQDAMELDEQVIWWTADEYEAWLDQEKKDLQECLGQEAWTSSQGWFTWTQDMIDDAIADYEDVLDEIKAGAKVSKPFVVALGEDGVATEATVIQTFPSSEDSGEEPAMNVTFTAITADETTEAFDSDGSAHFDVTAEAQQTGVYDSDVTETPTVELKADEVGASEALSEPTSTVVTAELVSDENGSISFDFDSAEASGAELLADDTVTYVVKDLDGAVTLESNGNTYTMTQGGAQSANLSKEESIALRAQAKAQQLFGSEDTLVFEGDSSVAPLYFKKFEPFDLVVQPVDGGYDFYYKTSLVNAFVDDRPDGSYFSMGSITQGGEIDVQAVYDEKGKLVGIEEIPAE